MHDNSSIDDFMSQFPCEGLTFDDVSLITQYADFLPDDTDIGSRLTSRINVNIPLVSAAMDTVTEARTAIAMAQQGGLGFVHRNLPPERQATEVERVKKSESGKSSVALQRRSSSSPVLNS